MLVSYLVCWLGLLQTTLKIWQGQSHWRDGTPESKKEKGPENKVRMGSCKGHIIVGLCEGRKERKEEVKT
jgi:hypothetical protein